MSTDTALAPTNGVGYAIAAPSVDLVMPSTADKGLAAITAGEALEQLLVHGDLSKLTESERIAYYSAVCLRAGLDPVYRPFLYLQLQQKLVLYPTKGATDQLTRIHKLSVELTDKRLTAGTFVVSARVTRPDGGIVEDIGAVFVEGVRGQGQADGMMKAVTKAKRRCVLSALGLGMLAEEEASDLVSQGKARFLAGPEDFDPEWGAEPERAALPAPDRRRDDDRPRAQAGPQEAGPQGVDSVRDGRGLFAWMKDREKEGCQDLIRLVTKEVEMKAKRKIRIIELHGEGLSFAAKVAFRRVTAWKAEYQASDDPEGAGHE